MSGPPPSEGASRHAYPTRALLGDYARALGGLALVVPPLFLLDLERFVAAALALFAALFATFGARTALRQLGPIEMTESGIRSTGPLARRLDWAALDDLRLAYYATRRDGRSGWMQLGLRAGGARLRLDSRIEGFAQISTRAVAAARRRRLPLSPTTATNLAALGIDGLGPETA